MFFNLGKITFKSLFKKPITIKYPFKTKKPYEDQKGVIENVSPKDCILCGICSKRCPCSAIFVDKEKRQWSINRFNCIQCGYCIDACPKKCLKMKADRPAISTNKDNVVVDIPKQAEKK